MEFLFEKEKPIRVILDPQADSGIRKIWGKVAEDIRQTTGAACIAAAACADIADEAASADIVDAAKGAEHANAAKNADHANASDHADIAYEQAILVCTMGQELADRLRQRVPGMAELEGKWESYWFGLVEEPVPGVSKGLVIAGSDKLGTIYGMFHISELLGVTAWGFWGDVAVPAYSRAIFADDTPLPGAMQAPGSTIQEAEGLVRRAAVPNACSKEPSVQFRGFFINDEWPCFGNWATAHFGGFNAQMYEHVFEYLLRMKGNYLWPAMWSSNFLLDGPGLASMELATEYGIYIGMSHHEPCMRSGEEFTLFKGEDSPYGTEWDYAANTEGLLRFWEDSLKRVKGQQVFPTVGMRGERDSKMLGEDSTIEENVRLLKEIIRKQRELIRQHLETGAEQAPQLFAIYKEVEDYYFGDSQTEGIRGYDELEDVTLLFCDDNFGNMRALPQAAEWGHPGGFGMYYHLDYHGSPISYEWVNSTPLNRVWEQMSQAYDYGVRKLWIVNVGDVKFQEYSLGYFMELAYDHDTWGRAGCAGTKEYTARWLTEMFAGHASKEQIQELAQVLEETVRLHGLRRAESLNDRVYHPAHYLEGQKMLARAQKLEEKNEKLMAQLSATPAGDAYFSVIYFPAAAVANLLKMHLYAGFNHLYAAQGKAAANQYGEKLQECMQKDQDLARQMAEFRGGKWSGMEQASHIGFVNWNDEDCRYPVRHVVTLPKKPRLVVSRADSTKTYTNQYFPLPLVLDDFLAAGVREVKIQIANGGSGELAWQIEADAPYLEFSARSGRTEEMDEVTVRLLADKLPACGQAETQCRVLADREMVPLLIRAQKPELSQVPIGAFVMQNNVCVWDAADYSEAIPGVWKEGPAEYVLLADYGKYGSGMKAFPTTAIFTEADIAAQRAPGLEYEIWVPQAGTYRLDIHTSPANPLVYGGSLRVGLSVDHGAPQIVNITGEQYRGGDGTCAKWADAVLAQEHVAQTAVTLKKGRNRLTLWAQDAGVTAERFVLLADDAALKKSYFGPDRSYRKSLLKP